MVRGVLLGVGQIFACDALGPSLLILGAVLLYSPLLAVYALLGSATGALAGVYLFVFSIQLQYAILSDSTRRLLRLLTKLKITIQNS